MSSTELDLSGLSSSQLWSRLPNDDPRFRDLRELGWQAANGRCANTTVTIEQGRQLLVLLIEAQQYREAHAHSQELRSEAERSLGALRDEVGYHRIELLSANTRWPRVIGMDGPQITSCDRALWTAAGVEPDSPYEDHPLERLHALTDRFRARIDEARWLLGRCDFTESAVKERANRWLLEMP